MKKRFMFEEDYFLDRQGKYDSFYDERSLEVMPDDELIANDEKLFVLDYYDDT